MLVPASEQKVPVTLENWHPQSYYEIVTSWGYDLVGWETSGEYQGDYFVLLRDEEYWGLLVIGYGSCGGCDALESELEGTLDPGHSWAGVHALAESLKKSISWFADAQSAMTWIDDRLQNKDGLHWWPFDEDMREAVRKLANLLIEEDTE